MKKLLHRIITVMLMLSFGISAMMYFLFDAAQFHYKEIAHNNITAKEDLYMIKLPLEDFKDHAGDNEVWDHGKLYDVSSYIIINDSACVWVFHDKEEEHLINTIVSSFEPNEQCTTDNIVHIFKHRIHNPDGKILVARYKIKCASQIQIQYAISQSIVYSFPVCLSVIKPPPEHFCA